MSSMRISERFAAINIAALFLFIVLGFAYHSSLGTVLYWLFKVAGFPWFYLADKIAGKSPWVQSHLFNIVFNWIWYGGVPIFLNSLILEAAIYFVRRFRAI